MKELVDPTFVLLAFQTGIFSVELLRYGRCKTENS